MEKSGQYSTAEQKDRLKIILAIFKEGKSNWTQAELRERLKIVKARGSAAKKLERDLELLASIENLRRHDEKCPTCGTLLHRPVYSLPEEVIASIHTPIKSYGPAFTPKQKKGKEGCEI